MTTLRHATLPIPACGRKLPSWRRFLVVLVEPNDRERPDAFRIEYELTRRGVPRVDAWRLAALILEPPANRWWPDGVQTFDERLDSFVHRAVDAFRDAPSRGQALMR